MEVQVLPFPQDRVDLVNWTPDPAEVITTVCQTYDNFIHPNLETDPDAIAHYLRQIAKTGLQTPLEFVHFTFLVRDVTRAFTHQIVRYRIGCSFVQENMRFNRLGDDATHGGVAKILVLGDTIPNNPTLLKRYTLAAETAMETYDLLAEAGIHTQEARGLVPTNILTKIWWHVSLRALIHIWGHRMCHQAQPGEWQSVLGKVKMLIERKVSPAIANFLVLPCERGELCPFRSTLDRECPHQSTAERFDRRV